MKRITVILLMIALAAPVAMAQGERGSVRKGNRAFGREKYQAAEIDYKKALLADSLSNAAGYNLGNTYYRLENYQEADKAYGAIADSLAKDPRYAARLYHNMGNSLLAQQNWQGAIEAYKNALRRNPSDKETKSNLAYAQLMLQNQQDQQQNQDQNRDQDQQNQQNQDQNKDQQNQQDQDQNKDQNKDQNQDQNKDQNQDQNQDQDQDQDQDKDQNQDQQQTPPPPQMSQQDARQMLQAIQDKEKETQDKVKKEKALLFKSKQKEKNW